MVRSSGSFKSLIKKTRLLRQKIYSLQSFRMELLNRSSPRSRAAVKSSSGLLRMGERSEVLPFRKRVNSDVTEKKLIVTERDMLEVGQVVGQLQEVAKRLASATDQLIDVIGQ